jgi:predicted phage terminase large subunit-like protein
MYYDGINDITSSKEYTWQELFPDVKQTSTNAKSEQINFGAYKPFPNVQCTSIGSSNAGKVRCNHLLMCDDLIGGIEVALNKNQLDKLWDIYAVDARQRKMEGCKELHIATRWSVHDVIGRLKTVYEGDDRARFIAVPDIDPETGESNFKYDVGGFTVKFFENQALLMDDISYRCLYKNEPIEREGLLYHKEDLRTYLELPMGEPDAILGVCDTKNKGTDFLVMPIIYVFGADHYLVDAICDDSSDYGVQYENLANKICEYNMQQVEFESNNGGDRVAFEVEQRVKERGGRCNITSKPTETNKETRIIVNADWIKKNVVFKDESLYTPKSQYGTFMKWLLSYSVTGKNVHDDVPDAMANYARFIDRHLGAKVTVTSRFF